MARRVETKSKREPMPTIIGAGITEQWYFTHLKAIFDYRVKVRPRFFGNETADMCSEGKLDQAIVRAKQFGYEGESYSRMDQVFDVFNGLKPKAE